MGAVDKTCENNGAVIETLIERAFFKNLWFASESSCNATRKTNSIPSRVEFKVTAMTFKGVIAVTHCRRVSRKLYVGQLRLLSIGDLSR